MANITMVSALDAFVDADTITAARQAIGIYITQSSSSTLTLNSGHAITFVTTGATNITLPTSGTVATTSLRLDQFAATTSAQLAGLISDETGTGALVFAGSPTFTGAPVLAAPTCTTINGLTISATSGTLALANSSTLSTVGAFAIALTATGATAITLPTSGTLATLAGVETQTNKTLTSPAINTGILTACTVTTSLVPTANDGAALGSTSNGFSDLHLATGALINIANSNWVATHSSGILNVTTGDLRVTTAGTNSASVVTVGGAQTLTTKTLTSPTITSPSVSNGTFTGSTSFVTLSAESITSLNDVTSEGNIISQTKFKYQTGNTTGDAVTQATSKSTGVTLNKCTGEITMNNASLNDATNVKFTVSNSTVVAVDNVIVNHKNGGTAGAYQVWANNIQANSFDISVRNVSGGALGEAIVLQFSIVGGARD